MGDVSLRESNLAQKYKTPGAATTLMIRNVPIEYTQTELIAEIVGSLNSEHLFDFFYLPWDTVQNANMGFAFVNFKDAASAQKATRALANHEFTRHGGRKQAKLVPAHIQGLENNLRHLQDRAVVHSGHPCVPVVVWKGAVLELSRVFHELRRAQVRSPMGSQDGSELPHAPPRDHINDFCAAMDRAAGVWASRQQADEAAAGSFREPPGLKEGAAHPLAEFLLGGDLEGGAWPADLASVLRGVEGAHRRTSTDLASAPSGSADGARGRFPQGQLPLAQPPGLVRPHQSAPGRLSGHAGPPPAWLSPSPSRISNANAVEIVVDPADDVLRKFLSAGSPPKLG